jgi:hypothetical protein
MKIDIVTDTFAPDVNGVAMTAMDNSVLSRPMHLMMDSWRALSVLGHRLRSAEAFNDLGMRHSDRGRLETHRPLDSQNARICSKFSRLRDSQGQQKTPERLY